MIVLSILFYRPFCKWLCPLGAFYALLNKVSLFQMKVDNDKCVSCGKCAKVCKMDVDVKKKPNHTECIRRGMCVNACPCLLSTSNAFYERLFAGMDKVARRAFSEAMHRIEHNLNELLEADEA